MRVVVRNVDSRARRDDEVWTPALGFVEAFRARTDDIDASQPLHVFLAEIAGNDRAQRITVAIRQILPVHLPGEDRRRIERLVDRNGVGVIVDTRKAHSRRAGQQASGLEKVGQRDACPNRVAHQASVESVADTH